MQRTLIPGLALLLTVYAIHEGLQFFAIVSFLAAAGIYYRGTTARFVELALSASRRARKARVGNLELEIGEPGFDPSDLYPEAPDWIRSTLSGLEPRHLGLLLLMATNERLPVTIGILDTLRELRARGLVAHDQPTLAASAQAWLTDTGRQVADTITAASRTA